MKIFRHPINLLSLLFIGFITSTYSQEIFETNATLESATIFGYGASLHHTANQISLPKGNSEVVINQVAQNIDPKSVRINSDNKAITILSVSFERDYLVSGENESTQYKELKKKFDDAQTILNGMTNARKAEESAFALLESNKSFGGQSGVTPASLTAMIKYYREEYKTLSANIISLKEKENEQRKKVDNLQ